MEYSFVTKRCVDLSDQDWLDCSTLFSEHYGRYSGLDIHEKGQRIKMGVNMYKRFYSRHPDMFVSLCYENKTLLGQAFFLKKKIPQKGICVWVTQLVVNSQYRNRKIGTRLLQSAWGFSDFYAWGLATANAITLKTLESVTWREISIEDMLKNIDVLETLSSEIPFTDSKCIKLNNSQSEIFSNFYPELELSNKENEFEIYAYRLGEIEPGYEWLAFTFNSQPMVYSESRFNRYMDFSEAQLKDAYSRMDMPKQPWTKGMPKEIDYIIEKAGITADSRILDLGCGQGRHSLELAKRGFDNIVGVDFAESNIQQAQSASKEYQSLSFICGDARTLNLGKKYDLVLCLYDVIGSFRDENDNKRILRTIRRHLKKGGHAIISVMNMELTDYLASNKCSLKEHPEALLHLKPSNTMADSGNIFKPEFYLINTDDGLVYRKEQFSHDSKIYSEYVVSDKRYTMDEIIKLVQSIGFKVMDSRYVQAGKWETPLGPTDQKSKEILLTLTL